jgi:hypothetical protein
MNERIPIKEWIESDLAKSLESLEDYAKWKLFEIVPSDKAYETYTVHDTPRTSHIPPNPKSAHINKVYAFNGEGLDINALKIKMGRALIALRDSAMAIKLEGALPGEGKLFIQTRMDINICKDNDFEDGRYKILWYGCMDRADQDCILTPTDDVDREDYMAKKCREVDEAVRKSNEEWVSNGGRVPKGYKS